MKSQDVVSLCELKRATTAPAVAFEEGKGHVSVNPVYGCNVGCPFCINQADPWRPASGGPAHVTLARVPQILEALKRNAATLSQLKLSLMDFCDPFEPALRPRLRQLLGGLNRVLQGQVVLLTSRLHPGQPLLRWMASLRNLRLSLFVSLGDACGGVRPVTPVEPRLRLLADSADSGLHTVMLLRPLVDEWTRTEVLRRLLVHARATCHEVVLAGLSMEPLIEASLQASGWPVPARPADAHGGVDPRMRQRVMELAAQLLRQQTPCSEHRSCAINRHHGLACKVAQREQAEQSARHAEVDPGRLESATWKALQGNPALRIKACSCFAPFRGALTTRACIGPCRFQVERPLEAPPVAGAPVKIRACKGFCAGQDGDTDGKARDSAGYCLLAA